MNREIIHKQLITYSEHIQDYMLHIILNTDRFDDRGMDGKECIDEIAFMLTVANTLNLTVGELEETLYVYMYNVNEYEVDYILHNFLYKHRIFNQKCCDGGAQKIVKVFQTFVADTIFLLSDTNNLGIDDFIVEVQKILQKCEIELK